MTERNTKSVRNKGRLKRGGKGRKREDMRE